jgi:hypothetical protein
MFDWLQKGPGWPSYGLSFWKSVSVSVNDVTCLKICSCIFVHCGGGCKNCGEKTVSERDTMKNKK